MSIATAGRWTQSMGMQGLQAVGAMSVYGWQISKKGSAAQKLRPSKVWCAIKGALLPVTWAAARS